MEIFAVQSLYSNKTLTDTMMHILEIPSFFPPHGGLFVLEQARALQTQGNMVRILACVQLGMSVDGSFYLRARRDRWWEEMNGVEVYRSYMRTVPCCIRPNQQRWCRIVQEMYEDYKQRYGRPDVLHAHCCQWAGVAARMIAEREGIPFFITEHLSSGLFNHFYGKGWKKGGTLFFHPFIPIHKKGGTFIYS